MAASLVDTCLVYVAENAALYSDDSLRGIPGTLLEQLLSYLSASHLHRLDHVYRDVGIATQMTWQLHLDRRWPLRYQKAPRVFDQGEINPHQRYLEKHFHELLQQRHFQQHVDPQSRIGVSLHKLSAYETGPMPVDIDVPSTDSTQDFYDYAQYVRRLTVLALQCQTLVQDTRLMAIFQEHVQKLDLHLLKDRSYPHARQFLIQLLEQGALKQLVLFNARLNTHNLNELFLVCSGNYPQMQSGHYAPGMHCRACCYGHSLATKPHLFSQEVKTENASMRSSGGENSCVERNRNYLEQSMVNDSPQDGSTLGSPGSESDFSSGSGADSDIVIVASPMSSTSSTSVEEVEPKEDDCSSANTHLAAESDLFDEALLLSPSLRNESHKRKHTSNEGESISPQPQCSTSQFSYTRLQGDEAKTEREGQTLRIKCQDVFASTDQPATKKLRKDTEETDKTHDDKVQISCECTSNVGTKETMSAENQKSKILDLRMSSGGADSLASIAASECPRCCIAVSTVQGHSSMLPSSGIQPAATRWQGVENFAVMSTHLAELGVCLSKVLSRWTQLKRLAFGHTILHGHQLVSLLLGLVRRGQLTDLIMDETSFFDLNFVSQVITANRDVALNTVGFLNTQAVSLHTAQTELHSAFHGVVQLDMSDTSFHQSGVDLLVLLVKYDLALRQLKLNRCKMSEQQLAALMEALKYGGRLEELSLVDNSLGGAASLELISLLENLITLRSLDISVCKLDKDIVASEAFQRALSSHPSLQFLGLAGNRLGEVGCQLLLSIGTYQDTSELPVCSEESDPPRCLIRDQRRQQPKLKELNLGYNLISGESLVKAGEKLQDIVVADKHGFPLFHMLNIAGNFIQNHQASLMQTFRNVTRVLNMDSVEGSMPMADHLSQM